MRRPGYPTEFRRKILDPLAEGARAWPASRTISGSASRRSTRGAARTASTVASSLA